MSHFERGSERHPIPTGESALAIEAGRAAVVPGPGGPARRAILRAAGDGHVVIQKVQDAELHINGVRLGAEPTPLLHGDKVGAEGVELTYVDERRGGSTLFVAALSASAAAGAPRASPGVAGAATGGRLVCLTDGREYGITGSNVVFGREASCDVVVSGKDVSRRHAEILVTGKGYLLIDHSTNGTFVGGERLQGQRLLARGDVIRVGNDEFRFSAETVSTEPWEEEPRRAALVETLAGIPRPPASPPPEPVVTAGGSPSLVGAKGQAPRSLASFLVRSGPHKGMRLPVRALVVNLGRADYNDLVLDDSSVSAQHAKIQRREGVWVLVDLDSTNGTFVDGERVVGETALAPGAVVRFGDISALFEPSDDALGLGKGTPSTTVLAQQVIQKAVTAAGDRPPDRDAAGAVAERAPAPAAPVAADRARRAVAVAPGAARRPPVVRPAPRAPVVRRPPRRGEPLSRPALFGILTTLAAAAAVVIWLLTR